jgi:hypothetical protein
MHATMRAGGLWRGFAPLVCCDVVESTRSMSHFFLRVSSMSHLFVVSWNNKKCTNMLCFG